MEGWIWLLALSLVAVFGLRRLAKMSSFKGGLGEWQVRRTLEQSLPASQYTTLHDVTLPSRDGTTQIDHIVLSVYGIFVIETKRLSGWIFGSGRDDTWTQTFHRSRTSFQNPLRQNFAHIKALETLLGLDPSQFYSLVIFTGEAEFKTPMPENVTGLTGLLPYIQSCTEPRIDVNDIARLVQIIETHRLRPGLATHLAHVDALRARHGEVTGVASEFKGVVGDTRKFVQQAIGTVAVVKAGIALALLAGFLAITLHFLGKLQDLFNPEQTQITTDAEEPAASHLAQKLFPSAHATLEQDKTQAWEASLMCAYSEDTGRCACYEPKGPKADVQPERCIELADKGAVRASQTHY